MTRIERAADAVEAFEMDELFTLTILYTYNIGGRLEALPRLMTLIKQEREAAPGPVLLIDGGNLCAREAWPCRVTHGRAGLSVLDAMGYDTAVLNDEELFFVQQVSGAGKRAVTDAFGKQASMPLLCRMLAGVPGIERDLIFERVDLAFGVTTGASAPGLPARPGSLLGRVSRTEPNTVLRDEADLIIVLEFRRASRPGRPSFLRSGGGDIVLSPDEAQNRRDPPALLVAPYSIDRSLRVHAGERRLIPCTDDIPPEPTIAAVLDLVMEEAERLRVEAGLDKDAPPPPPAPSGATSPDGLPDWLRSLE